MRDEVRISYDKREKKYATQKIYIHGVDKEIFEALPLKKDGSGLTKWKKIITDKAEVIFFLD